MQIYDQKKNKPENCSKIRFGRVLCLIWKGFGSLWAVLGPLLGAFWMFVGRSKAYLFNTLVQHGLPEAFWIDFGKGWAGFGCVLWELGFSKLKLLHHMVISWTLWASPAASHFATGTPALHRFASRSVTIRGGSGTTYACWRKWWTNGLVLLSLLEWVFVK